MSSLSAGKIQVENLSVAGLGAGAIKATNLKFENLDVSGNLTVQGAQVATQSFVSSAVQGVIGSAGAALDTLGEIQAALGDDANLASTLTTSIATKANAADVTSGLATKANAADVTSSLALKANLANPAFTGTVDVSGSMLVRGPLNKVIADAEYEIQYNDAMSAVLKKYKIIYKPTGATIATWDSLSNELVILGRNSTWNTLTNLDPMILDIGSLISQSADFARRTLVLKNDAGVIVPDLATNLGVSSNDNKTWTYTLQTGVKYENNVNVTADDIKYSLSRYFDPGKPLGGNPLGSLLNIVDASGADVVYKGPYNADQSGKYAFDNAVTVDSSANSITFNFKISQPNFTTTLSNSFLIPIPQAYDTPDRYWQPTSVAGAKFNPLSSGPYKITTHDTRGLIYEKNTYWSQAKDTLRTQVFTKIYTLPSMSTQLLNAIVENDIIPNAIGGAILYALPTRSTTSFPGRFMGLIEYKNRYPQNIGDIENSIFQQTLSFQFNSNNILDINARAAIFWATNIQSYIDKSGGDKLSQLTDSLGNIERYSDYQPTTGGIHDSSYNKLGNVTQGLYYMGLLQTSNPSLYTRMTTTGINMLEYTGIIGAYDGMIASLKSIGVVLNVTSVTKTAAFASDPNPTNPKYPLLVSNTKWDILATSFGDLSVLARVKFMTYPAPAEFTPGWNVCPKDSSGNALVPSVDNYQTMLDKINEAYASSDPVVIQTKTTEAMQICIDNYFIILPINNGTYTVEGSLMSGTQVSGDGLGQDFKRTAYNS